MSACVPKKEGSIHYVVGKDRGCGSYGVVKEAKEVETGERVALKQLNIENMGIPNLMEISIMSSLDHPCINGSRRIFCTQTHLNIVQHLAQSDLHDKIVKMGIGQLIDPQIVVTWMFLIAQAVKILHKLNIVHGDLKTRNILYFNDADVKLTDFSLSVKMWNHTDRFTHQTGTYTFCPPENLLGKTWDKSLDIWSLGCVFYQMAFGNLLFPNQGSGPDSDILKLQYYNSIADYCGERLYDGVEFIKAVNHPYYSNSEYSLITSLIDKMLKFNPSQRLTIDQVLDHDVFKNLTRSPGQLRNVDPQVLSGYHLERLINTISLHLKPLSTMLSSIDYTYVHSLAIKIYQRIVPLISNMNIGEFSEFSAACIWIALKMVVGRPLPFEHYYSSNAIIRHEIMICDFLHFCVPLSIDD